MYFSKIFLYLALVYNTGNTVLATSFNATKIVAIADVHGDIWRFRIILRDARIIDKYDRWIAEPDTVVVQLGDQIDPKTIDAHDISDKHHFEMIYFTNKLEKLAKENGSKFISVIGNHEHMNIVKIKRNPAIRDIIANRPIVVSVNNYLFCHGSFKSEHDIILKEFNKTLEDVNSIWIKYVNDIKMSPYDIIILNHLILDTEDSILYTKKADSKIDTYKLLNAYNTEYMFVGHKVTNYIHVKNRIWYLDLLLKESFDDGMHCFVTISDGDINIKMLENYHRSNDIMSFYLTT